MGRHTKEAGLYLQDAYHEFDSILTGETFWQEARTLAGRLDLYRHGLDNLEKAADAGAQEHELPRKLERDLDPFKLPQADDIKDERELKARARVGRSLAEKLGEAIGIDPVTGETPQAPE